MWLGNKLHGLSHAQRSGEVGGYVVPLDAGCKTHTQKVAAYKNILFCWSFVYFGLFFAKLQGIQTLKSGMVNLYQNKMPIYEIMSGASIAIAALLLIIPGFFTDLIGFLLLIPFTRRIIFSLVLKNKSQSAVNLEDGTIDGEIVDQKKDEL